jgi:hypothetical protein
MIVAGKKTAVGAFADRAAAENALEALHRAGFASYQLGFVTREGALTATVAHESPSPEETNVPSAAAGAVGGGVIGGALAAVVALLIPGLGTALVGGILAGAAIGALTGGFAGSLVSLGVPEEDARYYQEQLAAGCTLVTVSNISIERYREAVILLRQNGAYDAVVKNDLPSDLNKERLPAVKPEEDHALEDIATTALPAVKPEPTDGHKENVEDVETQKYSAVKPDGPSATGEAGKDEQSYEPHNPNIPLGAQH